MLRLLEDHGRTKPLSPAKLETLTRVANAQYGLLVPSSTRERVGHTALRKDMNTFLARVFNVRLHKQLSDWTELMLPGPVQPDAAPARVHLSVPVPASVSAPVPASILV